MAVIYYPKGQFVAQRTTLDPLSASYDQIILACNPDMVLYFDTGSNLNVASASNLQITSSWAQYALTTSYATSLVLLESASYASASTSASYAAASPDLPNFPYTTIVQNLSNWFTCSFSDNNEYVALTYTASFYFTHSNPPPANYMSDLVIVISSSAVPTASLIFPPQWKNLGGNWPTYISGSRIGIVSLRAIGENLVVGTWTQTLT